VNLTHILVIAGAVGLIALVNWYFFVAGGSHRRSMESGGEHH
jgi:hypothetical protein